MPTALPAGSGCPWSRSSGCRRHHRRKSGVQPALPLTRLHADTPGAGLAETGIASFLLDQGTLMAGGKSCSSETLFQVEMQPAPCVWPARGKHWMSSGKESSHRGGKAQAELTGTRACTVFSLPSRCVSSYLRDSHAGGQAWRIPESKSRGFPESPQPPGTQGRSLCMGDILPVADQNSGDRRQECSPGMPMGRAHLQELQFSVGTEDGRIRRFL